MIQHIDIKCSGRDCNRHIGIHLVFFQDLGALADLLRDLSWRLVDGKAAREDGLELHAASIFCIECARKVLPPEQIAELDKEEEEKRAKMS